MFVSKVSNLNTKNSTVAMEKVSNITFEGNAIGLISKNTHNLKKLSPIDKSTLTIIKKAQKITNEKELPITKNPIVAALDPIKKAIKDKVCDVISEIADKGGDAAPDPAIYFIAKGLKWVTKIVKHYDDIG